MFIVDRSIAILKPKKPFLDWLNTLPGNDVILTLEEIRSDCTVILIPEVLEQEEGISIIDDMVEPLFDMELASWVSDADLWPKNRTLKLFWEWFDVEIHISVFDCVDEDTEDLPSDPIYH